MPFLLFAPGPQLALPEWESIMVSAMAPLFCLLNQALLLKLKLTILLLLGLLLKAKVRLGVFSALGSLVALLNLLVIAALVLRQQQQRSAAAE